MSRTPIQGPDLEGVERDLSFEPVDNPHPKVLTADQIAHFNQHGFIRPIRIFEENEVEQNRVYFDELLERVMAANDDADSYSVNGYHTRCPIIYDMCLEPRILDAVEDLVGPNFVAWGTHYFCKLPHDERKVPWHQDASYWPFDRSRTVTVWLAIDDADEENAAMKFIPGTHKMGHLDWGETNDPAVLVQEITGVDTLGEPCYDTLKAGEISLHADMLAHGSDPSTSDRRRCGLTIRYCPVEVRALTDWHANAIICRGSDLSGHWISRPRPVVADL